MTTLSRAYPAEPLCRITGRGFGVVVTGHEFAGMATEYKVRLACGVVAWFPAAMVAFVPDI